MTDMPIPGNESTKQTGIYDAWNRLTQVKDHTGNITATPQPPAPITNYQLPITQLPSSPTSYYDYYYNESWQVLEERKDASTNPYAQYVWDARYIDAPVVRFHDSNTDGTLDDTLYYTTDANMNVTALVDTSGTVQERYTYDAYGQVHISDGTWTARSSSSYDNQILFGGYRFDPETGLDHVRNRMYHPTLGRWGQRDPKGYPAGLGLYEYVKGRISGRIDPAGTDPNLPGSDGSYYNPMEMIPGADPLVVAQEYGGMTPGISPSAVASAVSSALPTLAGDALAFHNLSLSGYASLFLAPTGSGAVAGSYSGYGFTFTPILIGPTALGINAGGTVDAVVFKDSCQICYYLSLHVAPVAGNPSVSFTQDVGDIVGKNTHVANDYAGAFVGGTGGFGVTGPPQIPVTAGISISTMWSTTTTPTGVPWVAYVGTSIGAGFPPGPGGYAGPSVSYSIRLFCLPINGIMAGRM